MFRGMLETCPQRVNAAASVLWQRTVAARLAESEMHSLESANRLARELT